jgi:chemotaxis protein MotB
MKRKNQEHVNHDRWLVSYADFITLLFAFFVVLYSSSQVDKRKAGRLALAIQVAFQELGVFQTSNTKIPLKDEEAIPFEKVQVVENISKDADLKQIVNPMKGVLSSAAESQSLQEAQAAIQKALNPEIQRHEVAMTMRREGLVVSLREMGFFDSGSADIRPASLDAISRLAGVLKQRPENLRIEGHTDNVPIHTARFTSNWELSTARATELIQLLITKYGIPPGHLSAAGYGEFHPVAGNDTAEGRAQNRRLDVVILAPYQLPPRSLGNEDRPAPATDAAPNPSEVHP